jgi:tetratricopeptide (TPR) repeat protein
MTLLELDETAKKAYYSMDLETALRCYAEVFLRHPTLALAYNNYGNILREYGYPVQAYGFLETAMRLDPHDRNTPFNYAVAHLAAGDLENGWELFESRWRFKFHEHTLEGYDKPRWHGEDINGKKLLITCEEGDGDNMQFIRFVYALLEKNIIPIIQTELNLKKLFANSFPNLTVIDNTEKYDDYDYWTPILSLPRCLKITYNNLPKYTKYLQSSNNNVTKWKNTLKEISKPKIGFCWKGRSKSYPLTELARLIELTPQYQYINLQINCNEDELELLNNLGVKSFTNLIDNWYDTSGLLENLDVIISIDTGLVHLAGALNIPTILLLDKYKSCWRWMYETTDTHWYLSVELVRQIEQGNCDEQLFRVYNILAKKIDPEGSIT